MRFTRLRLNGFKSFVDPTDVLIAEGLTGVVGPNGCGKSNLLEALRWVMGETRPTAMRGDGMEDVIFAGATSRPARHFAEVALTIDNAERLAPTGFNEADAIEIVRRITRDAGSAYKANTRDVRARDVQMLFADASTGSHSPALVRQGQISELINARPQARRRILEEAAGISGLYARRHEAELKLNAAEANLARVDDVVEQLAAQLGALARQARQAARYREIGAALRLAEGTLLFRRWAEADAARAAAGAALRERTTAAATAERRAREAAAARETAAAALAPLREEETIAAAVLQRLVTERGALDAREAEAAREAAALEARIAQLGADLAREAALDRDAGETLARLEREAAELGAAGDGHAGALAAAAEAARAAAEALAEREAALAELTEDAARLAARHASAERLSQDAGRTLARAEAEAAKARTAVEGAEAALARATEAEAAMAEAEAEATKRAAEAEAALAAADRARGEAQGAEAEARAARSAADGEAGALRAEVAALARLAEGGGGGPGQVIDQVRVAPGHERALGAALADEARAPAIEGDAPTGWAPLPPYQAEAPLPAGVMPLAAHVDVPEVLRRRIAQVGLVEAGDGPRLQAALQPGQRLVSRAGDLWRWDGFRAGAADAPSAAALRLEQRNRLERLRADLATAETAATEAAAAHEARRKRLEDLTRADREAREARRGADARATEATRAASRAAAERNLAAGRLEALTLAVARHHEEAAAAQARVAEAERALAELGDVLAAREALEAVRLTVEAARVTTLSRRAAHEELRRAGEARAGRLRKVAAEAASWRERGATAGTRIAELTERRAAAEAELRTAAAIPAEVAGKRADLQAALDAAERRRRAAADALATGEAAAREAAEAERASERDAGAAREARAAAEARADAADEAAGTAAARIADEREATPAALLEALGVDPDAIARAEALEDEVQRLKRAREALGAVNLRAEEDARAVEAEHGALVSEKADLEAAIRALRGGIAGLNREGRERLLTAFEQVNANFATLFTGLFGGGEARLELVESDDPLEAGLEILCQPPGKKLSTLSLLSGGEQTLTALALIFAVFLANPAPICVLDEVDAPLDDANVTRFCDLLDDMTRRTDTRFLIITHHAVTMSRMDRLYGVTMAEPGVSQLVSVDLRRAEQLVA